MAETIEIVTFRLKEGTTTEAFIAETVSMERNFLAKLKGFMNRDTGISEDGDVVVVLHWESPEDAQASINKFVDAEGTKAFTAMIEMETFVMKRYELADHYDLV
ncbi:MAG: hypothetical protein ACOCTP_03775 [Roseicyclus sp.]